MIERLNIDELKIKERVLVRDISISIFGRDKIVIIGKNGCGKTTLIKKIYENLRLNKSIKVGYLPQDILSLFYGFESVLDFINENMHEKYEKTKTRTFLGALKLTDEEVNGKITDLSGGTKVKLALAKLMAEGVDVLVLDEPTRNLSPLSNPILRTALKNYNGAIISVSHDRKYIREVANKVFSIKDERLVEVTDKILKKF